MENLDGGKVADSNVVGLVVNQPEDKAIIVGRYRAWTTRDGEPVAGLVREDGTALYEIEGENALSDQMKNLLRDVTSRLGTNASGPAGGLWTAGPYVGLTTVTVTAGMTLGTITEASGNGYTARQLPTWTAGATGQFNNTASAASWTASGGNLGGGALQSLFTTPAASGTGSAPNVVLISFMALNGGPYTVATGNTLNVTYTWTVS
jgi:hypothetical protein